MLGVLCLAGQQIENLMAGLIQKLSRMSRSRSLLGAYSSASSRAGGATVIDPASVCKISDSLRIFVVLEELLFQFSN